MKVLSQDDRSEKRVVDNTVIFPLGDGTFTKARMPLCSDPVALEPEAIEECLPYLEVP